MITGAGSGIPLAPDLIVYSPRSFIPLGGARMQERHREARAQSTRIWPGLGFPAAVSHFTRSANGDIRVVDFGDSFEHRCDPETCEELKKLVRLLDEVK